MTNKPRTTKKPKGTRSESLGLRLDPRMKFALELLSRAQRRSISGTVEWCVEQALRSETVTTEVGDEDITFEDLTYQVWDVDPFRQLVNLCSLTPKLATFEELQKYRVLCLTEGLWRNTLGRLDADNLVDIEDPLAASHAIHDIIESGKMRGLDDAALRLAMGVPAVPF